MIKIIYGVLNFIVILQYWMLQRAKLIVQSNRSSQNFEGNTGNFNLSYFEVFENDESQNLIYLTSKKRKMKYCIFKSI